MDKIIPRWEWRTFSASLDAFERAIGPLADVAPWDSSEIYVLNLHGPQNAKLRDGFIDIKRLQQVDDDGLELWEPVFKAKFPLGRGDIAVAFSEWHLPLPALSRDSYHLIARRMPMRESAANRPPYCSGQFAILVRFPLVTRNEIGSCEIT